MMTKLFKVLCGGVFGIGAATCSAQFLPALAVEPVTITDSAAYAELVESINTAMKEAYGVPLFLRAYESTSVTGRGHRAFSLSPAGTFETLMENQERFESSGGLADFRIRLAALSDSHGRVFLKAVRFDGTNSPGYLLNHLVKTSDEASLLTHLTSEFAHLERNEVEMPKVNVFRVIAGASDFTHLVSLNFESSKALGSAMDAMVEVGWEVTVSEGGDIVCELIESVVYREL